MNLTPEYVFMHQAKESSENLQLCVPKRQTQKVYDSLFSRATLRLKNTSIMNKDISQGAWLNEGISTSAVVP